MRETIAGHISAALAARTTWFIREQDIQLYLVSYFMNTQFYDNVFIEYHVPGILMPPYLLSDADSSYIDIVLEKDQAFYPVEINYKTTAQSLQRFVFGQAVNSQLKQSNAQNISCYDFWKDIRKIEFLEASFPAVKRGMTLFISNDPSYQKAPNNPQAGYAPFSIHQGRHVPAGTTLNWNVFSSVANSRPGFGVNYYYVINWVVLPFDQQHAYILV
ncbi:MAG: hypothetical protein ABIQ88_16440 [Chitinophagaceae bacterium]